MHHTDFLFFYAAHYGEHVYCWAVARRFDWGEVREAPCDTPANDPAPALSLAAALLGRSRDPMRG
jgi:hypothetical protein